MMMSIIMMMSTSIVAGRCQLLAAGCCCWFPLLVLWSTTRCVIIIFAVCEDQIMKIYAATMRFSASNVDNPSKITRCGGIHVLIKTCMSPERVILLGLSTLDAENRIVTVNSFMVTFTLTKQMMNQVACSVDVCSHTRITRVSRRGRNVNIHIK